MSKSRNSAIAFAGCRGDMLLFGENELSPACIRLKARFLAEIIDRAAEGYRTFYCGAEKGIDMMFARQVLLVKVTEYPNLKLICVIAYEGQANAWGSQRRSRYDSLLAQADENILISNQHTYDCHHRQNRYMVDRADMLLAAYDASPSCAAPYAVQYAYQENKEIVVIDPRTLERKAIPPRLSIFTPQQNG